MVKTHICFCIVYELHIQFQVHLRIKAEEFRSHLEVELLGHPPSFTPHIQHFILFGASFFIDYE